MNEGNGLVSEERQSEVIEESYKKNHFKSHFKSILPTKLFLKS